MLRITNFKSIVNDRALKTEVHMPSINKQNPNLDVEWFKNKLAEKKLSTRALAKLLDVNPSTVSLMLRGIRAIHNKDAVKLADIFSVTTIEIFKRAGAPIEDEVRTVPVTTYIDEHNKLVTIAAADFEQFNAPFDAASNSYAMQVRNGRKHDGWVFVVGASKVKPEACLGSLVVYCTEAWSTHLGIIKRGYVKGTYSVTSDLLSESDADLPLNVNLLWCQPVIWIKPA